MYKISKGFNCRTVKGTNLVVQKGMVLKSYVVNYERDSVTLDFPDMTCEIENDFDIAEYIVPMVEEDTKACSSFEQQKDRTYRHGVTKNYAFVDNPDKVVEDCKDEEYKRKRIDIRTILDYHNRIDYKPLSKDVIQFLQSEKERLNKEYDKLTLLVSSDSEIAIRALSHMKNDYLKNYDMDIVHKIEDVINRFSMTEDKGEE
jgi:hypothetical protein